MRKVLSLITVVLFLGFTACNNSAKKSGNSSDSSSEMQHEMGQMAEKTLTVPAVPNDARVYFKNLKDGETVTSPFKVEMGVEGMEVEPSGKAHKGFGHHHLVIDHGDFVEKGKVIPADSTHIHFGGGQTETELSLPPGEHKLTLQFADGLHRSYGKQLANSITITVE